MANPELVAQQQAAGTVAVAAAPADTAAPAVLQLDAASIFDQVAAGRIQAKIKGAVHGITPAMLLDYLARKAPVTPDEMRAITTDLARDIIYTRYWKPLGGDKHPAIVAAVIDIAFRRSVDEATKTIQAAVPLVEKAEITKDGRKGVQTDTAIDSLIKAGKDIALLEAIDKKRRTIKFRLGDGKFLGHDIDSAGAIALALRVVMAARSGRII